MRKHPNYHSLGLIIHALQKGHTIIFTCEESYTLYMEQTRKLVAEWKGLAVLMPSDWESKLRMSRPEKLRGIDVEFFFNDGHDESRDVLTVEKLREAENLLTYSGRQGGKSDALKIYLAGEKRRYRDAEDFKDEAPKPIKDNEFLNNKLKWKQPRWKR